MQQAASWRNNFGTMELSCSPYTSQAVSRSVSACLGMSRHVSVHLSDDTYRIFYSLWPHG